MGHFDLAGALRRIRRTADLSQRELAARCDLTHSAVAQAESGRRDLPAQALARAAAVAGLRLLLVDADGRPVAGMTDDAVRDMGNRRFPAHLDTRYGDDHWWHDQHRYSRGRPWYTFDRSRDRRDACRRRDGTPADHQTPQPGDSPQERAASRKRERLRRRAADKERAFLAGEFARVTDHFECTCLPSCDEMDAATGELVHAEDCPCSCDVC